MAHRPPDRPGFPRTPEEDRARRDESRELQEIRDALDIPGIVDVHTHFMPERVLEKVWSYFDRVEPFLGRPWPVTYRMPETDRIEVLEQLGVLAFPALAYAHKPGMAEWLNDWTLDFARANPRCLPTATFHAEADADRYVSDALEAGAVLFKVHVQVGDFDPNEPVLDSVWSRLEELGVPIVVHAGSGPAPGRFTGPEPIARLLERFGNLVLIIAHMGLPEYREFLDLAERFDGVHLDTTMAFTPFIEVDFPFPADQIRRLVDFGDRILFGSDFPNIPYRYVDGVRAIIGLDLGDRWLRGVLHDNAARLGLADRAAAMTRGERR